MVVRNPIKRLVSDIVHEFLVGSLKSEEMPDIDDMILQKSSGDINERISGGNIINIPGDNVTLSLGWVDNHLYPMSNYTNVLQKMLQIFPSTQILVVNGDNLIKFVNIFHPTQN